MPVGNLPSLRSDRPPSPPSPRGLAILGPRQLHVTGQHRVRQPSRGSRGRRGSSAPGAAWNEGAKEGPLWGPCSLRCRCEDGPTRSTGPRARWAAPRAPQRPNRVRRRSGRLKHPTQTARDAPPTPCLQPVPEPRRHPPPPQIPTTHRPALLKPDPITTHPTPPSPPPTSQPICLNHLSSTPHCTCYLTHNTPIPPRTHFACLPPTESDADPGYSQS